jgi:hypothetical protein
MCSSHAVTPCSPVEVHRPFGGIYHLHIQGGIVRQESTQKYVSGYKALLCCATSWKVADSRPNEVNDFFSMYLTLPAALGPEVYSASNRNEYRKH